MMMATFHEFARPPMDAVAVADTGIEVMPNTLKKYVGTLAVCVTLTALLGLPVVHPVPPGSSTLRHIVVTVGVPVT
jgi:hypothetical protein